MLGISKARHLFLILRDRTFTNSVTCHHTHRKDSFLWKWDSISKPLLPTHHPFGHKFIIFSNGSCALCWRPAWKQQTVLPRRCNGQPLRYPFLHYPKSVLRRQYSRISVQGPGNRILSPYYIPPSFLSDFLRPPNPAPLQPS